MFESLFQWAPLWCRQQSGYPSWSKRQDHFAIGQMSVKNGDMSRETYILYGAPIIHSTVLGLAVYMKPGPSSHSLDSTLEAQLILYVVFEAV
jgi:hypothetical protein